MGVMAWRWEWWHRGGSGGMAVGDVVWRWEW